MSGTWRKLKKTLSFSKSFGSHSNNTASAERNPSSSCASSKKTCSICLANVRTGQALFTAECSHSFHFNCIANNVRHGNYLCPICRFKWKEIPFQMPGSNIDNWYNSDRATVSPDNSQILSDDELPTAAPSEVTPSNSVVSSQNVTVETFTEFPAVAALNSISRFAVLVSVQAPQLLDDASHLERASIDLVIVLDVSGSMEGPKLALLKHAVHFVIDNLDPSDQLALVSFSSDAKRILPLCKMTDRGREDAKRAINLLSAYGGTNILEGLKKGAKVLEERCELNPVASIILLTDGRDTYSTNSHCSAQQQSTPYLDLLPASICLRNRETRRDSQRSTFPVHSFGFGSDHDSAAMHAISDVSGGTFSFIESVGMVQDAFARCIGGLLSMVAQEFQLTVKSASPGVEIVSIPSGRHSSEISEQGSLAVIKIGDLYSEEKKKFLVYLAVPTFPIAEDDEKVGQTSLLDVGCSYKDAVSQEVVHDEDHRVEIHRPKVLSPTDEIVSLEVDRERNRLMVAEGLTAAREMAEMGNLEGARALLTNRRSTLLSSASAQAGDNVCKMLESELSETSQRMESRDLYEHIGRAYVLSGLSSHSWQRATTRGDTMTEGGNSSTSGAAGYQTPSMTKMVSKSQNFGLPQSSIERAQRLNKSCMLDSRT